MIEKTVCEKIDELEDYLISGVTDEELLRNKLKEIRKSTERMEARLLRYRRSIEVLGFKRDKNL